MSSRELRVSPLSIAVAVAIAALSVVGFAFTQRSADQQEKSLLVDTTGQASLYVNSVFSGLDGTLSSLAADVSRSDASPAAFAQSASAMAANPLSLTLLQRAGDTYVVRSTVGKGLSVGQVLSGALASAVGSANSQMTATPVVFDGRFSTAGFAVGPPLVPAGYAILMQFTIDPFSATPVTAGKPFSALKVALYGSSDASRGSLLVATTRQLPVADRPVVEHPMVGNAKWTLVASARAPLIGSFARDAPKIILGMGVLIAISVGVMLEALDRRHRYAAQLVAERTADLQQSLVDLKSAQDALVRGERLTALGEMASVVGHELRNPLSAVTNSLYLLRQVLGDPADPSLERHLAMAERETGNAASLAADLTAFVRPRVPSKSNVELAGLVDEVVATVPPPERVELTTDVDPITVHVDRRQFAEVLGNLVTNAYQAVGDRGNVRVGAHHEGESTVLTVEDSGPGLDREMADRVFEPFFTTKHDGTGLGLAIVRRLVEAHDGEINFDPVAGGKGARVVIRLPLTSDGGTDGDTAGTWALDQGFERSGVGARGEAP